ncbi:PspC domain-containing protein [Arcanobacterium hippocoleae]
MSDPEITLKSFEYPRKRYLILFISDEICQYRIVNKKQEWMDWKRIGSAPPASAPQNLVIPIGADRFWKENSGANSDAFVFEKPLQYFSNADNQQQSAAESSDKYAVLHVSGVKNRPPFYRRQPRVIAGVCRGLSVHLGGQVNLWRLAAVLLSLTGIAPFVYLLFGFSYRGTAANMK